MTTPATPPAEIHKRLAKVLAGVKAISKDRQSGQDGYGPKFKYRGVDDVYNELHDLFGENEIYLVPEVVSVQQTERQTDKGKTQLHAVVTVRYTFTASDGSKEVMTMVGEAADSGDKSLGKACQYAIKVLLLQAFLIPTEGDNDPDAQSTEWASRQQPPARQPRERQPAPARQRPQGEGGDAPAKLPADAYEVAAGAIRKAKDEKRINLLLDAAEKHETLAGRVADLHHVAGLRLAELEKAGAQP